MLRIMHVSTHDELLGHARSSMDGVDWRARLQRTSRMVALHLDFDCQDLLLKIMTRLQSKRLILCFLTTLLLGRLPWLSRQAEDGLDSRQALLQVESVFSSIETQV